MEDLGMLLQTEYPYSKHPKKKKKKKRETVGSGTMRGGKDGMEQGRA
jgi:hypothetical protein